MAHAYNPDLDAFELYHLAIEKKQKTSILGGPALPAIGHAVSGAAGSAISTVLTYPLSLVVTRLQVQKHFRSFRQSKQDEYKSVSDAIQQIYEKEGGIKAFFNGCEQDVAKTIVDSFLFFLAYNFVRDSRLRSRGSKKLPMHEELGVGMVAGAFSRLFTTPISNVVARKQTAAMIDGNQSHQTVAKIAENIRKEKGILGFWSGYSATLVLTFNPAVTFLLHETLLRLLIQKANREKPGGAITFIFAALSKGLAACVTYPFSLAKARSQVSAKSSDKDAEKSSKSSSNIFQAVINTAQEEGLAGLYQGLEGEILKGFFAHGLTMMLKERIHKFVIRLYYLLLKLFRRYPSEASLRRIRRATSNTIAQGEDKVTQAVGSMQEVYHHAQETAKDFVDSYLTVDNEEE